MPDTGAALKDKIEKRLTDQFGADSFTLSEYRGEVTVQVDRDRLRPLATFLRDDPEFRFDSMAYMTAVDWLLHNRKPRFDIVYHLYSYTHHHRLRIKATVPEDDCWSPSLWPVWKSCNFMEREAYDMFGITFREHPDLRRILMPDDWEGWPLRKDFPMGGVKSFYFKRDTEPHAGEPEELVPRIRVQQGDI